MVKAWGRLEGSMEGKEDIHNTFNNKDKKKSFRLFHISSSESEEEQVGKKSFL